MPNPKEVESRARALRAARRHANLHAIPCTLKSPRALRWPSVCPVLGIPMSTLPKGRRGMHNDSATLDRLDPAEGYTRSNTRVVSGRAKRLRRGRDLLELDTAARRVREQADELTRRAEAYEALVRWLEKEMGL